MKDLKDITQAEYEAFERHKKLMAYTPNDIAELLNLVRTFINKHHSECTSCSSGLRATKDVANQFLANNRERILQILAERNKPEPLPEPTPKKSTESPDYEEIAKFTKPTRKR